MICLKREHKIKKALADDSTLLNRYDTIKLQAILDAPAGIV